MLVPPKYAIDRRQKSQRQELPEMSPILLLSLAATTSAAWVEDTFFTNNAPSWRQRAGKLCSRVMLKAVTPCVSFPYVNAEALVGLKLFKPKGVDRTF